MRTTAIRGLDYRRRGGRAMTKYVYFPSGREVWRLLPDILRQRSRMEPVLWIGDDRHLPYARSKFQHTLIYSLIDCLEGNVLEDVKRTKRSPSVATQTFPDMSSIQQRATQMMNRIESTSHVSFLEREFRFWNTVTHFSSVLDYLEPDALISAEAPHSFPQYIIYELCRLRGIPTLHFCSSNIAPFMIPRFGIDATNETVPPDTMRGDLSNLHARIAVYFQRFADRSYAAIEPEFMQLQRVQSRRRNSLASRIHSAYLRSIKLISEKRLGIRARMSEFRPTRLQTAQGHGEHSFFRRHDSVSGRRSVASRVAMVSKRNSSLRKLQTAYSQAVSSQSLAEGFVYFPLHKEPERTTNPEGGRFWSQYFAIRALRESLPQHVPIVFREHPSQFRPIMNGHLGRSPLFYSWVRSLQNTFFVDVESDPYVLLTESSFVATITGTAALEAVSLGRPALVLGHPWYAGVPGTFNLSHIGEQRTSGKAADRSEVETFVHNLVDENGLPGVVNPSNERLYRSIGGFGELLDPNRGAQVLAEAISGLLRKQVL